MRDPACRITSYAAAHYDHRADIAPGRITGATVCRRSTPGKAQGVGSAQHVPVTGRGPPIQERHGAASDGAARGSDRHGD